MTEDIGDKVYDLQMQAWRLPEGETQLRLYEEALRLAEQSRNLDLIFPAKLYVASSAGNTGYEEKTMAALAWCVATFEKDEQRFQEYQKRLVSHLKTFLCSVSQYSRITREQIEDLLQQFESLLRRFGYSMRTALYVRMHYARKTGNRLSAIELHDKYVLYPRDNMSSKVEEETEAEFWQAYFLGDFDKAIQSAEELLTANPSSSYVLHNTYTGVLRPLAIHNRYEEADQYQKKGYRLIRNNRAFLDRVGQQIAYLVHRERPATAIRMFERHLFWALETHDQTSRFYFYVAAKNLFCSLPQKRPTCKLSLPPSFPLYEQSNEYDVAKLIDWLQQQISPLAIAFDQRNGNDYFSREIPAQLKY